MKLKIWGLIFLTTIAVVLLAGCASSATVPLASDARVFKFSLAQPSDSSWFKGAVKFAELVKQRTNGRYAVTVFPNASMASGDQNKELEMVQQGTIDFAYISTSLLSNADPRYNLPLLPWLFASNADVDKMINGPLGNEMLGFGEAKNMIGLGIAENGFRQLSNSKREIKTPDDLKGLKIRTPNVKAYTSTFTALGASPVSLSLPQVYEALQQGTLDGQENAFDTIIANKFYDVQKYITVWNYSYSALFLVANKTVWASLDKQSQDIFLKAAADACAFQIQEARRLENSQIELLKSKGVSITILTPDQIKAFRDKVAPVYTEYEPIIGKDLMSKYVTGAR
jgi:tripartite ATP-independent transporter DctP family solute receptor